MTVGLGEKIFPYNDVLMTPLKQKEWLGALTRKCTAAMIGCHWRFRFG